MNNRLNREDKIWRFWKRVTRSSYDKCWSWLGQKDKDGYGVFSCRYHFGETRAARIAFLLCIGIIPKGLFVLHRCDNPECTNPTHLFLGTALDNMHDKISKGRQNIALGSRQGTAKLNESQIEEIKCRYRNGKKKYHHPDNQIALAKEFNVDQAQISRIVRNKSWTHV